MLRFLFPRLTTGPDRGTAAFAAIARVAREPDWYRAGKVPDSIDGRFAVLATVLALVLVRLEQLGEAGEAQSVAITERFIAAMEAEHRELGLGDPTLGKTVRRLVGSLAGRLERLRAVTPMDGDWSDSVATSLYSEMPAAAAIEWTSRRCASLHDRLQILDAQAIAEGKFA